MDDDTNAEIIKHIEELAHKGVKLSNTQVWILVQTYDRHKTIKQLATDRGLSYQGMYLAVNDLESKRLLDKTHQTDREWYYICRFDISETADFTFKVKYKKQVLTFEDLIWYLPNAANIIRTPDYISYALRNLYLRSEIRESENKVPGPTPPEIRSFLMSLITELEEFTILLRHLVDMKLFDPAVKVHELMGEMNSHPNTRMFIEVGYSAFNRAWENKNIGAKGLIGQSKPKTYSEDHAKDWKPE
jgi:hypothetical protein